MKKIALALLLILAIACQTEFKVRKQISRVDSVDQALQLKENYPKWDIVIHKLDSASLFEHRIYTRLNP